MALVESIPPKKIILQSKLADTSRIKINSFFLTIILWGGAPIKNKNFGIPTTTLKVGSSCHGERSTWG